MAKSRNIGGIYAELSLKDLKFRKGLKAAGAQLSKFAGMAIKGGAVASGALAAGLAAGTKKTITYGAELDHMSTQTGVAVSSLIRIGQAYKDNGKSADTAGKDINKMQRAIYEASQDPGGSMDYFAELGLSAEELMKMNPEAQFFAIGNALLKVQNQTKQTAVAMDIFGRSGAEVLKVFKGTTLEDVNASLGRMPEIMEQFSGAMERADTLMGRLPNKSDQFFAGFTAGVVGQILPGLEQINDKDFTELGERIGDGVAQGLQLITDGTIWDVFILQAEKAFLSLQKSQAVNGFAAHLNTIFDGVMTPIGEEFDYVDTLSKYYRAGEADTDEAKAEIDRQIAAILSENKKRTAIKRAKAAEIGADVYGPELPPAIQPIIDAITEPKKEESRNWESSSYSVNEMQRRGLGMGGEFVNKEEKQQVTLLQSIEKVLKQASTTGGLQWA